jgi:ABC-type multidrug transport system ATPase subunit
MKIGLFIFNILFKPIIGIKTFSSGMKQRVKLGPCVIGQSSVDFIG